MTTLVSLVLCGCGSDGSSLTSAGTSVGSSEATVSQGKVFGTVYTQQFIADATVEILDGSGSKTYQSATTDEGGGFELADLGLVQSPFLIRVQTANGLILEREVDSLDGFHLWVNVLTTIVARHHRAHRELTLLQSEAAVRAALRIPQAVSFDGISDLEGSPFSHSVFFQVANAQGGLVNYLPQLIALIDAGLAPSFVRADPAPTLGIFFPKATTTTLNKSVGEIAVDLVFSAGTSVLSSAGTAILGKICVAAGLNIGSEAAYANVQAQLAGIQQDIANLFGRIVIDSSRAEYNTILNSVNDDKALLGQISSLLNDVAQQGKTDASNFGIDKPRPSPPAVQTFLSFVASKNFDARASGAKISDVTVTVTDNNATLALGKALGAPMGVVDPTRDFSNYDLRRDDLTLQLQNSFNYFAGLTVEAENVATELSTTQYLPAPLNQPAPHPSLNLLGVNSARTYLLQQDMRLRQGSQLVAGRIGNDLILLDMKAAQDAEGQPRHYMWYLKAELKKRSDAQSYANSFRLGNLTGWRLPTQQEMDLLYSRTKNVKGGRTRDRMVKLGFQNIQTSHDNDRKYWYSPYPKTPNGMPYYNLQTGKQDEDIFVSAPKYTVLLIRVTPDFSQGDVAADALSFTNEIDSLQDIRLDSDAASLIVTANVRDIRDGVRTVDVSQRVDWTSSDPSLCDVVLTPGGAQAVFHAQGEVTLTANYRGKTLSKKFVGNQPKLQSIMVSPRNLGYLSVPQPGQFQQFDCSGYLSDGTVSDLSSNNLNPDRVAWTLLTTSGTPLPSSTATVSSVGVVTFGSTPISEFRLRATHASSGQVDEVTVKVVQ